jgi:hypothetical protein
MGARGLFSSVKLTMQHPMKSFMIITFYFVKVHKTNIVYIMYLLFVNSNLFVSKWQFQILINFLI